MNEAEKKTESKSNRQIKRKQESAFDLFAILNEREKKIAKK